MQTACGINEGPVCGSGNGCAGALIRTSGQTSRFGCEFLASQGALLGRSGLLRIAIDSERIQVDGISVTCIDGQLAL